MKMETRDAMEMDNTGFPLSKLNNPNTSCLLHIHHIIQYATIHTITNTYVLKLFSFWLK